MLDLPTGRRGRLLALGVTLCLAMLLWFGAIGPLLAWRAHQVQYLAEKRLLAARMETVADSLPALRREAARLSAQKPGTEGEAQDLLEGGTDALAGAALEERLQKLAAANSVPVGSAEILPATASGSLRRIGLRVTAQAKLPEMVRLLAAIDRARPLMLLDDLDLRGQYQAASPRYPALNASFVVYGFRSAEAQQSPATRGADQPATSWR